MTKTTLRAYVEEIDQLIESEQLDEAIAHCFQILQIHPKHVDSYRLLGKSYLEAKRYGDAADVFQRVLSAIPDDFVSHIGMAIIREDEGNLDASIWHMERSFETNPSNPAIQQELRRLIGRRDGFEPQKVRLTRGALARMYARGELYPQAIAELRSAMQDDPDRPDLQALLGEMYYRTAQQNEAIEVCLSLLDKIPFCVSANRIMAAILQERGKQEETSPYRRKLTALDPYFEFTASPMDSPLMADEARVTINRLAWRPGQPLPDPENSRPDWAASLGANLASKPVEAPPRTSPPAPSAPAEGDDDLPDWLRDIEPPKGGGNKALSAIKPLEEETQDDELPSWMRQAGWSESDGTVEESGSFLSDADLEEMDRRPTAGSQLSPATLPDWLQGIAPKTGSKSELPPAADPDEVSGDVPGWIETLIESDEELNLDPAPDPQGESTGSQTLPGWLEDSPPGATDTIAGWLSKRDVTSSLERQRRGAIADEPATPEPPSGSLEEEHPGEIADEPAADSLEQPARDDQPPSWLDVVARAAADSSPSEEDIARLRAQLEMDEDPPAEPLAAAEAPDWLKDIARGDQEDALETEDDFESLAETEEDGLVSWKPETELTTGALESGAKSTISWLEQDAEHPGDPEEDVSDESLSRRIAGIFDDQGDLPGAPGVEALAPQSAIEPPPADDPGDPGVVQPTDLQEVDDKLEAEHAPYVLDAEDAHLPDEIEPEAGMPLSEAGDETRTRVSEWIPERQEPEPKTDQQTASDWLDDLSTAALRQKQAGEATEAEKLLRMGAPGVERPAKPGAESWLDDLSSLTDIIETQGGEEQAPEPEAAADEASEPAKEELAWLDRLTEQRGIPRDPDERERKAAAMGSAPDWLQDIADQHPAAPEAPAADLPAEEAPGWMNEAVALGGARTGQEDRDRPLPMSGELDVAEERMPGDDSPEPSDAAPSDVPDWLLKTLNEAEAISASEGAMPSAPAKTPTAPAEASSPAAETTAPAAAATTSPAEGTTSAVEETSSAVKGTTSPAEDSTSSAEDSTSSAEDSSSSAKDSTSSAEDSTSSAEDSTSAAEDSTSSAEDSSSSAKDSTSSAEDSTSSAEDSTSAAEDSTSSAEDSTSSAEETTRPIEAPPPSTLPPAEPPTTKPGPQQIIEEARSALRAGNFSKAAAEYRRVFRKKEHLPIVIDDLKAAVNRHPSAADLWDTLGDAYMRTNHLNDAIEAYRRGLKAT